MFGRHRRSEIEPEVLIRGLADQQLAVEILIVGMKRRYQRQPEMRRRIAPVVDIEIRTLVQQELVEQEPAAKLQAHIFRTGRPIDAKDLRYGGILEAFCDLIRRKIVKVFNRRVREWRRDQESVAVLELFLWKPPNACGKFAGRAFHEINLDNARCGGFVLRMSFQPLIRHRWPDELAEQTKGSVTHRDPPSPDTLTQRLQKIFSRAIVVFLCRGHNPQDRAALFRLRGGGARSMQQSGRAWQRDSVPANRAASVRGARRLHSRADADRSFLKMLTRYFVERR
jgi:hypothetical protein